MKTKLILSALILAFTIGNANAQIANRQANQHKRIKHGVKNGELTKAEAANLIQGQREIRHDKREAKADGVFTATERKEIRQNQKQESRKIYRKKHNRRDRN